MKPINQSKSLQELENSDWGDPATGETPLVEKCLALRRKPIGDFTIEDLRVEIGQQIGLKYLVPLAIEQLNRDPLCEGDLYPGDLLQSVLRIPAETWLEIEELRAAWALLPSIARRFLDYAKTFNGDQKEIFENLIKAAECAADFDQDSRDLPSRA